MENNRIQQFIEQRVILNEKVLETNHLGIKRFFNLDTSAYTDGALSAKEKELLGLTASLVLRCNDCVDYHIIQCIDAGFSDKEIIEALNVGLVVCGSIVIPHLRHAIESIELYHLYQSDN
ncbi:MAG: carboxymuconolactone decarboxylase family protein [Anaerolineaceae bacterium]|nr:carboxymuconolactone decarboxylase family protein [Anaerolineaceae bacterium]